MEQLNLKVHIIVERENNIFNWMKYLSEKYLETKLVIASAPFVWYDIPTIKLCEEVDEYKG